MKNPARLLNNKNKFLILGCGFTGNFFAKTVRKLGCTAITSSRSKKKDPDSFVFNSENGTLPNKKFLMESHIFLVAYLPTKMEMIQY